MDASTSNAVSGGALDSPMVWIALFCTAMSTVIVVGYLWKRPPLVHFTKIMLFLGIAVFPIGAAVTGNVVGYTKSQKREFCGSCHVMTPYANDSGDPESTSLASMHGRNTWFGENNCYTCHSDYGMYGAVATKLNGLRHVYEYYWNYREMPLSESLHTIKLYKPFKNTACLRCHSTGIKDWRELDDHRGVLEDVREGRVTCLGEGCHGPAHPFSKPPPLTTAMEELP